MHRIYQSCLVTVLVILFSGLSTASFSADETAKNDKLVVASMDLASPSPGENIFRGELLTVTAQLKSNTAAKSGPLKVRIYLSDDPNGTDIKHEFDIFHDLSLDKSGNNSAFNREVDRFHNIFQDKSGGLSVKGQYVIPYTIPAGHEYYIVVEISPEEKAVGSGENKTKITHGIQVPCDAIPYFDDSISQKFPAYNFCGERD